MAAREMELVGGAKPKVRRRRKGGWTKAKRTKFLLALAATCNIAESLRRVRMSSSGLWELRKREAGFRAQWAEAIREGYAQLELKLLERAMNGTLKTVTKADGAVETVHEFPNHIALRLLQLHRETAAAAEAQAAGIDVEPVRERLGRKLDGLRRRLEKAAQAEAPAGGGCAACAAARAGAAAPPAILPGLPGGPPWPGAGAAGQGG